MIPLGLRPFAAEVLLPSPNHGPRPAGVNAIACVVLHATADGGDEAGAESWMRNPASQASAHLHIRRSGTVVRWSPISGGPGTREPAAGGAG